ELRPEAVCTKYPKIKIPAGTTFSRQPALSAGPVAPPLPIDGGLLTFGATSSLSLASTNLFAPGTSDLAPELQGGGGQVAISASDILVLASDQSVPAADCASASA